MPGVKMETAGYLVRWTDEETLPAHTYYFSDLDGKPFATEQSATEFANMSGMAVWDLIPITVPFQP